MQLSIKPNFKEPRLTMVVTHVLSPNPRASKDAEYLTVGSKGSSPKGGGSEPF